MPVSFPWSLFTSKRWNYECVGFFHVVKINPDTRPVFVLRPRRPDFGSIPESRSSHVETHPKKPQFID